MIHGEYTLSFNGHALFHHSTVKAGGFNEVRSLDAPQVTTLYGALAQCASMLGLSPEMLEKVSITPPEPTSSIVRNMLILTAPLSPFDWQPKWINREGEYTTMARVYPRRVYALWRPKYRLHVFAEDEEALGFIRHAFSLLADYADGKAGANLRLGYKKKLFGSFDCRGEWDARPLGEAKLDQARVCEVFSDCPTRFNSVVPIQPKVRVLTYRNVHRQRGVPPMASCSVFSPGSVVLLKLDETKVKWYRYGNEALGVSELIERRQFGDANVKAVQGLFLTHEAKREAH